MLPWYQQPRFRFAGAALLAGLVIGGLVTLALGYQGSPPAAIPERSAADAIASDHAAVADRDRDGPPRRAEGERAGRPRRPKRSRRPASPSSSAAHRRADRHLDAGGRGARQQPRLHARAHPLRPAPAVAW